MAGGIKTIGGVDRVGRVEIIRPEFNEILRAFISCTRGGKRINV